MKYAKVAKSLLACTTLLLTFVGTARAEFPDRVIRLVVPYSAGGGTDIIARKLAERLRHRLGQPVVVENKPGANGIIGTDGVAKAPADGHSYVMVVNSHLINPLVTKQMPFDTFKDLIGVTMVATSPLVFVTRNDFPASNSIEFANAIRRGAVGSPSYGSSESMTRLVGALFVKAQRLDMVHIPYKGGSALMNDVVSGVTTVGVTSVLTAKQLIAGGRLRALGLTGVQPSPILPDVPTLAASGMKDFDGVHTSYALYAPAATPRRVLERMRQEVSAVLSQADMRELLKQQGATPVGNSVADFNAQIVKDAEFWRRLAREVNLQPE
jgi:tripartite-type tricarboxylate transporter receptor subunit TctC